jgi:hypothetical protein
MHRVLVDPHKGRIYLENEHTPRLFLDRAQKYFECSIGDVLCAKEVKERNGSYLLILTSTGKSSFSSFNGYKNVRDAFADSVCLRSAARSLRAIGPCSWARSTGCSAGSSPLQPPRSACRTSLSTVEFSEAPCSASASFCLSYGPGRSCWDSG